MGVKWTPEQESTIIALKDSSLDKIRPYLLRHSAGSEMDPGSCRTHYYAP